MQESPLSASFPVNNFTPASKLTFHSVQNYVAKNLRREEWISGGGNKITVSRFIYFVLTPLRVCNFQGCSGRLSGVSTKAHIHIWLVPCYCFHDCFKKRRWGSLVTIIPAQYCRFSMSSGRPQHRSQIHRKFYMETGFHGEEIYIYLISQEIIQAKYKMLTSEL